MAVSKQHDPTQKPKVSNLRSRREAAAAAGDKDAAALMNAVKAGEKVESKAVDPAENKSA